MSVNASRLGRISPNIKEIINANITCLEKSQAILSFEHFGTTFHLSDVLVVIFRIPVGDNRSFSTDGVSDAVEAGSIIGSPNCG